MQERTYVEISFITFIVFVICFLINFLQMSVWFNSIGIRKKNTINKTYVENVRKQTFI